MNARKGAPIGSAHSSAGQRKEQDTANVGPPTPLEYAAAGWSVFPLDGKQPALRSAHPHGDPLRGRCHGECGRLGHGLYDGSTDPEKVTAMFAAM